MPTTVQDGKESLKGSHTIGDGQIFLKNLRDISINKDLSNEPNFSLFHLAEQYLLNYKKTTYSMYTVQYVKTITILVDYSVLPILGSCALFDQKIPRCFSVMKTNLKFEPKANISSLL